MLRINDLAFSPTCGSLEKGRRKRKEENREKRLFPKTARASIWVPSATFPLFSNKFIHVENIRGKIDLDHSFAEDSPSSRNSSLRKARRFESVRKINTALRARIAPVENIPYHCYRLITRASAESRRIRELRAEIYASDPRRFLSLSLAAHASPVEMQF